MSTGVRLTAKGCPLLAALLVLISNLCLVAGSKVASNRADTPLVVIPLRGRLWHWHPWLGCPFTPSKVLRPRSRPVGYKTSKKDLGPTMWNRYLQIMSAVFTFGRYPPLINFWIFTCVTSVTLSPLCLLVLLVDKQPASTSTSSQTSNSTHSTLSSSPTQNLTSTLQQTRRDDNATSQTSILDETNAVDMGLRHMGIAFGILAIAICYTLLVIVYIAARRCSNRDNDPLQEVKPVPLGRYIRDKKSYLARILCKFRQGTDRATLWLDDSHGVTLFPFTQPYVSYSEPDLLRPVLSETRPSSRASSRPSNRNSTATLERSASLNDQHSFSPILQEPKDAPQYGLPQLKFPSPLHLEPLYRPFEPIYSFVTASNRSGTASSSHSSPSSQFKKSLKQIPALIVVNHGSLQVSSEQGANLLSPPIPITPPPSYSPFSSRLSTRVSTIVSMTSKARRELAP